MGHSYKRRAKGLFAMLLLATTLCPLFGCHSALATAMYVINGHMIDPEFEGLAEKRVAVVCQPLVELQYRNSSAAESIARNVGILLRKNGKNIKVIDPRKVAEWVDENTWDEYSEIGKAVEADIVVGIDLEGFSLFQGQTLYQGRANLAIKVFDCQKKEVVFEKLLPEIAYPPNTGVPTSDKQESIFRREFIAVVSDEIGRHFYSHDPYANFAMDSVAFK